MKEKKAEIEDDQLSKMLSTNTKYLSSVLNKGFDVNFTSFVNSYRIEKAKEFLLDVELKNYTKAKKYLNEGLDISLQL